MSKLNVDIMGKGAASGEVAAMLMSKGLNPDKLRPYVSTKDGNTYVTVHTGGSRKDPKNYAKIKVNTNGTLRRDEWKALDETVLQISRNRLRGIDDLRSRGLVYNLGNGMGTTVLESHSISDAFEAELSMDGVARSKGDRPVFSTNYLPIPIIHADFEINARVLETSRNMGNALDTTSVEQAARRVGEKLESMLFTDTDYTYGGGSIYSYLNHPQRNEFTLDSAWSDSGVTGKNIVDEVLEMKQEAIDAKHYGPYVLYVPTAYETKLDEDYSADKGTNTIRERIMQISNIADVKVVDTLTDGNVVLVQMTSDVVRLVQGMGIQTVQWQTEGIFVNKYKVMTIAVPQIRADQDGNSGIVHGSV